MPQMGESIAEGTIVRWIKKVGDAVDRDEPLFEISTDKVDAEIPSPAAGVLSEIRVREGETVAVNSVVATIGGEVAQDAIAAEAPAPVAQPNGTPASVHAPAGRGKDDASSPRHAPVGSATTSPGFTAAVHARGLEPPMDPRRQRSSPLVRRIAREHGIDIERLQGSGIAGRVTKRDILGYLGGARPATTAVAIPSPVAPAAPSVFAAGERTHVETLSVMRKKIAEHMVLSRRTSAHVHTVFEVSFHRVSQIREQKKADYERAGAKLTFMSFITAAVADALGAVPVLNASLDGDRVVYRKDVNVGIAVSLDWGLIVPVVRDAAGKSLLELSRDIADLAARARAKQLKPEDVQGGTFTITNPGGLGAQFGLPIINQPQVAILGVGGIEKRVVVIDDAIAIRPMAHLALGFDHRLVDGVVADQFMAHVKHGIEQFDPARV
jgi:2-oxoglutarate dehydrogenase E2 component (dihydrolipoamide succinyltransferase)